MNWTKPWAIETMAPEKNCDACGAPLVFSLGAHGGKVPINLATGKVHFEDCPEAGRFRKAKGRKESTR